MPVDPKELNEALAELDPAALVQGALDASLARVVTSIAQVFSADGVGIMLVDDEQGLRFVSATDAVSAALEAVETRTGNGPCVDAVWHGEPVLCSDLASERRWPAVREALVPLGARAILGMPLRVGGATVGALDVYRAQVHEWGVGELEAIRAFADMIAELLELAVLAREQQHLAVQLRHALGTRVVVERAVGYLMAKQSLDAVAAFNLLRAQARHERRQVAEVAEEVLGRNRPAATPEG